MYLRWVVDQSSTKEIWTKISELKENERELKKEAVKLRKYLLELHQSKCNAETGEIEDRRSTGGGGGGSDIINHPLQPS